MSATRKLASLVLGLMIALSVGLLTLPFPLRFQEISLVTKQSLES